MVFKQWSLSRKRGYFIKNGTTEPNQIDVKKSTSQLSDDFTIFKVFNKRAKFENRK